MPWKRVRKILLVVLIVTLLLSGGTASYVFYDLYFDPLPDVEGRDNVEGLQNQVNIYRDNWGIPYIYASIPEDIFFAQGYVHAQERWWQMELVRLIGYGKTSTIAGDIDYYQDIDRFIQTLDWEESARTALDNLSPEMREMLDAYSQGVNAYIEGKSARDLATEFGVLSLSDGYDASLLNVFNSDEEIASWEPIHSLLWMQMFQWRLSHHMWSELERSRLYAELDAELVESYWLSYPYDEHPVVLSAEELNIPENEPAWPPLFPPEFAPDDLHVATYPLVGNMSVELAGLIGYYSQTGGNIWVIDGEHTGSEYPLLAGDFLLPAQIPSMWYEISLHCVHFNEGCQYNVSGFSVAGIPGVLVGHNDHISWAFTPASVDTQDTHQLRLNPDNLLQYEWEGQWVDMEVHTRELEIPGEELPVQYQSYMTEIGPVLTDMRIYTDPDYPFYREDEFPQALAFQTINGDRIGGNLEAILALNQAQSREAFQQALESWQAPVLNVFYADIEGNTGYQMAGQVPIRHADHSGLVTAPGYDDRYLWQGTVPFDLLPAVFNPEDGFISSADNPVVPPAYYAWLEDELKSREPDYENIQVVFSQDWEPGYRASRLDFLLSSVEKHSLDSMVRIQGDNHQTFAAEFLPYIFRLEFDLPEHNEMRDWLKEWTLETHYTSPQATLFAVLWSEICQLTFNDQLVDEISGDAQIMLVIAQLARQPEHAWWDDPETPERETRDDILRQAFINAYAFLQEEMGPDYEEWHWGTLHTGTFISVLIGNDEFRSIKPVVNSGLFPLNKGPHEMSGGTGVLNTTAYSVATEQRYAPYTVLTLPSYRVIFNPANFNQSRAMLATGQSGHPASEHYADMFEPWRTLEYHNLHWDTEIITAGDYKLLELFPE